jgi:ABC-type antimicrobial peptide transport system permease subunit
VISFRPLPWEYGVRNLFRRPGRSLLTLVGLALVVLLILVVVGFVRGLESSLAVSGDPRVVLVHAAGGAENIENSTVRGSIGGILTASIEAIQHRFGRAYVSPEIYLGTRVRDERSETASLGLLRGVTPAALLVRRQVQLVEGRWPGPGEVLAGRLAGAKLGVPEVKLGQTFVFEGRTWRVSGRFAAIGSMLEAELWCPLEELQTAMKRQDYSLVALTLAPGASFAEVDDFCKTRLDLELEAVGETAYYEELMRHYRPVRLVAWLVAGLVAAAGMFAGMNAMYGAVVGRIKELATLQTVGFSRRAIVLSLMQESVLLTSAAALVAVALAVLLLQGVAVRFTMGAFALQVDGPTLLLGCAAGMVLGIGGAIPPAIHALRLPVVEGLRSV